MRENMEWYGKSKTITKIEEIPEGEHWVAIENQAIHIPGDERSRTNPGHGYPASTKHSISMLLFDDKEAMESWVRYQDENYSEDNYKILYIRTPRITKTVNIDIN